MNLIIYTEPLLLFAPFSLEEGALDVGVIVGWLDHNSGSKLLRTELPKVARLLSATGLSGGSLMSASLATWMLAALTTLAQTDDYTFDIFYSELVRDAVLTVQASVSRDPGLAALLRQSASLPHTSSARQLLVVLHQVKALSGRCGAYGPEVRCAVQLIFGGGSLQQSMDLMLSHDE